MSREGREGWRPAPAPLRLIPAAAIALFITGLATWWAMASLAPEGPGRAHAVETWPKDGARGVPAGLQRVELVFDRPMSAREWEWEDRGEDVPEPRGAREWADPTQATIPVWLEPGRSYRFALGHGLAPLYAADRTRAEPVEIHFETAPDPPTAPSSEELTAMSLEQLQEALPARYSYADLRGVDWDAWHAQAQAELGGLLEPRAFAEGLLHLLAPLEDVHVTVQHGADFERRSHRVKPRRTVDPDRLSKLVPGLEPRGERVQAGRWDDGTGYLTIRSFAGDQEALAEEALEVLEGWRGGPGGIIDLRENGGGSDDAAWRIATLFQDVPRIYELSQRVDPGTPGGFTPISERRIRPHPDGLYLDVPVAVLMGPRCGSATERFLLAMDQAPNARSFGEPSFGSSAGPRPTHLANGVTLQLPAYRPMRPDGVLVEGNGLEPDVRVAWSPDEQSQGDPVLEAALSWLRSEGPAPLTPEADPR